MKRIAVLGSTGSIGRNTLDVIRHFPDEFSLTAISAHSDVDTLLGQVKEFRPKFACVTDYRVASKLGSCVGKRTKLFKGKDGLEDLINNKEIDWVVLGISGTAGLRPLISAIEAGKNIALANKEALVMAGAMIMDLARAKGIKIMPIDSEQSAIFQCLEGREKKELKNIYLTASGGPLKDLTQSEVRQVTAKRVLRHPRWKMGRKITVDSATLMNKGLELIEAMHLFSINNIDRIKTIIHPEAIIHSMVEFIDGSILAQLSATDMRIPIQYALSYPKRLTNGSSCVDFFKLGSLTFQRPDMHKFPCLALAYQAAEESGSLPAVLNAANEVAVEAFLGGKIKFFKIPEVIDKVISMHKKNSHPQLEEVFLIDRWARNEAETIVKSLKSKV